MRFIATTIMLVVFFGAGLYSGSLIFDSTPIVTVAAPVPRYESVSVRPGDSLWKIAAEMYPGEHTGDRVEQIRRFNPDLDPGLLMPGNVVFLPK